MEQALNDTGLALLIAIFAPMAVAFIVSTCQLVSAIRGSHR